MLRALLAAAALVGTAQSQCRDCDFDLTKLEDFTVDFSSVTYFQSFDNPRFTEPTYYSYYYYAPPAYYGYGYYDDYGYGYYDDYGYGYYGYSYGYYDDYIYGYNYYAATALASQNQTQNQTILASHNQTRRLQYGYGYYYDDYGYGYGYSYGYYQPYYDDYGYGYGYSYGYNYGYYDDYYYDDYGYDYYSDDYRYTCCDMNDACDCYGPDDYDDYGHGDYDYDYYFDYNDYGYGYDYYGYGYGYGYGYNYGYYVPSVPPVVIDFQTVPLPENMPSDHGTLAVNARSVQLKFDNYANFPANFIFGDGYDQDPYGPPPVNLPLGGDHGVEIHEEFHINGVTRQASYHMESTILNICVQIDLPDSFSPAISTTHAKIDKFLAMAEEMAPEMLQQYGMKAYVNGEDAMGFIGSNPAEAQASEGYYQEMSSVVFYNNSVPALVTFPMDEYMAQHLQESMQPAPDAYVLEHLAVKFDNYVNSVGNAFEVRACEIEADSATQTVLAANPTARNFVVSRVAQHQRQLKALLQPAVNMQFNFIPLDLLESMFPSQQAGCTPEELAHAEELAQIPPAQIPSTLSSFQMLVCAIGSFAMGMAAVYGVLRKKPEASPDDYVRASA